MKSKTPVLVVAALMLVSIVSHGAETNQSVVEPQSVGASQTQTIKVKKAFRVDPNAPKALSLSLQAALDLLDDVFATIPPELKAEVKPAADATAAEPQTATENEALKLLKTARDTTQAVLQETSQIEQAQERAKEQNLTPAQQMASDKSTREKFKSIAEKLWNAQQAIYAASTAAHKQLKGVAGATKVLTAHDRSQYLNLLKSEVFINRIGWANTALRNAHLVAQIKAKPKEDGKLNQLERESLTLSLDLNWSWLERDQERQEYWEKSLALHIEDQADREKSRKLDQQAKEVMQKTDELLKWAERTLASQPKQIVNGAKVKDMNFSGTFAYPPSPRRLLHWPQHDTNRRFFRNIETLSMCDALRLEINQAYQALQDARTALATAQQARDEKRAARDAAQSAHNTASAATGAAAQAVRTARNLVDAMKANHTAAQAKTQDARDKLQNPPPGATCNEIEILRDALVKALESEALLAFAVDNAQVALQKDLDAQVKAEKDANEKLQALERSKDALDTAEAEVSAKIAQEARLATYLEKLKTQYHNSTCGPLET